LRTRGSSPRDVHERLHVFDDGNGREKNCGGEVNCEEEEEEEEGVHMRNITPGTLCKLIL
jgi:hypothetical protein